MSINWMAVASTTLLVTTLIMYAGVDKYGGAVVGEATSTSAPVGLSLEDAVETAAAEETVVVDVPYSYYEDEEDASTLVTGTTQVLLAAQLNPEAGGLMWAEQEDAQAAYKNVVAMSQMTSMLRDHDRNRCYERGIARAIASFREQHGRAPLVLDIGTGTGLLAMFAATHGAEHVYACEMFAPMAEIAANVTGANHPDRITVFPLKSTALVVRDDSEQEKLYHLPRRADMLVSELFDSVLLGEAVLPTIRHAMEHLLVPNAVIVPERATVFAQVVQNEQIYRFNTVADVDLMAGSDKAKVTLGRSDKASECTGARPALPLHYRAVEHASTPLTEPTAVLSFDFSKRTPDGNAIVRRDTVVDAIATGDAHAVVMWWDVRFDGSDDAVVYSTRPGAQNWQDHWVQVVFPLAEKLRVSCEASNPQRVTLHAFHDDFRVWFDVQIAPPTTSESDESATKKHKATTNDDGDEKPPCTCGLHLICNAERIAMLSEQQRTAAFRDAIASAVSHQREMVANESGRALACLDISDGSLCALLAATQGVENVTSIESKEVSARIFEQILDHNNADALVLCCGCKGLLPDHLKDETKVDLLVGEPFYYAMQNLPLWQAFNFWLRRSAVDSLLRESATIVPHKARVMAMAVQFEHLHECFGAVGNVSGYDHSFFDQFQDEYYTRNFPFPAYMYPFKPRSSPVVLATLELSEIVHSVHGDVNVELDGAEAKDRANAVIVWVEYALDRDERHVVATGPAVAHAKQLIRFLPPATDGTAWRSLQAKFAFDSLEGTIALDFTVG